MSIGSETFNLFRKIFTISDELARLNSDMKELTKITNQHDVRQAVIENTLALARRPSNLILPGN